MIEAITPMITAKITKPIKAGFMENRQKGKNITKPIEAKPLTNFSNLQNQSYLQTQITKPISLNKKIFFKPLFTKQTEAGFPKTHLVDGAGMTEGQIHRQRRRCHRV